MLGHQRASYRSLLETMARPLGALGFSPNSVTMLSVLSCLLYVYWASNGQWALALLGAGVSAVLDALDGALARLTKKTSAFGNYLDAYVDRIIEFFLVLPLIALAPRGSWSPTPRRARPWSSRLTTPTGRVSASVRNGWPDS